MSESLFPSSAASESVATTTQLPLAKEVAWDFVTDKPIFRRGEPVIVIGLEAVKVWVWNALKNERYRYEHHTRAYGNELERLIGQTFTGDLKQAEAIRYFKEALAPNPYITSVDNVTVELTDSGMTITGTVKTIYGNAEVTTDV